MRSTPWVTMLATALLISACAQPQTGPQATGGADSGRPNVLRLNAALDPDSMDPALIASRVPGEIATTLFEGLVRLDDKGEPAPGIAEKWTVSPDGLTYTFTLRKNAKWTDGHNVTAQDFVYSYERSLRPATAAPLSSNLFYVKNGIPYNKGELKDASQLGLKAKDDYTLETVMEAPTAFWIKLTAFFNMLPVHKETVESNKDWTKKTDTFISNGPFKLEKWTPNEEISVTKNPDYWNKGEVKLDRIVWKMINDSNTSYQSFLAGEFDEVGPPPALTSQLLREGKAQAFPASRTDYIRLNNSKPPFNNANVRKAFALSLERTPLVEQVLQGKQKPALAFIPAGLSSGAGDFRTKAGDLYKEDPAQAKQLLAQGLKELNLTAFPDVPMDYISGDVNKKVAEVLQAQWKKNLGLDVRLNAMERKSLIDAMRKGGYTWQMYSTGADFDDAINLVTQFMIGDGYNYGKYANPEYDRLINQALKEADPNKRAQQMIDAEKIFIQRDMGIVPLFYGTNVRASQPYVKGVRYFPAATNDYSRASVR